MSGSDESEPLNSAERFNHTSQAGEPSQRLNRPGRLGGCSWRENLWVCWENRRGGSELIHLQTSRGGDDVSLV